MLIIMYTQKSDRLYNYRSIRALNANYYSHDSYLIYARLINIYMYIFVYILSQLFFVEYRTNLRHQERSSHD